MSHVSEPRPLRRNASTKDAGLRSGSKPESSKAIPLLLWRLKPNLNHAVWDFTVLSTNAQHFRADYPIGNKPPGTYRIVCLLAISVTFGYRVPVVWPGQTHRVRSRSFPSRCCLKNNCARQIWIDKLKCSRWPYRVTRAHQGLARLRRDIDRLQPDMVIAKFWLERCESCSDAPDREAIRTDWYPVTVRWLIDHSQAFAHATHWLRSGNGSSKQSQDPSPRVSNT